MIGDGFSLLLLNLWNVNEPFEIRMAAASNFIERENPDIVAFQEVPVVEGVPQFPTAIRALGYDVNYLHTGYWEGREEGISICSRLPVTLLAAQQLDSPSDDMGRGVIALRVRVSESSTVLVLTTHLAHKIEHDQARLAQAREISNLLERIRTRFGAIPTVLAADLNCLPEEKTVDILQRSTDGIYLRDVQKEQGAGDRYTFSASNTYVSEKLWPNRRIDYILASDGIQTSSLSLVLTESDGPPASDHYGLYFVAGLG